MWRLLEHGTRSVWALFISIAMLWITGLLFPGHYIVGTSESEVGIAGTNFLDAALILGRRDILHGKV